MHRIKILRQQCADKLSAMEALRAGIVREKRLMTDEERQRFEALEQEHDALRADLQAEERLADRRLGAEPASPDPDQLAAMTPQERVRHEHAGRGSGIDRLRQLQASVGAAGRRYADLFGAPAVNAEGWQSSAEFLAAVHAGRIDGRLRPAAMASGSSGADGGFAYPDQFAPDVWDLGLESEIVRPRCQVVPMVSDVRRWPGINALDHSSHTLFGAFTGQWVAEGEEITEQTPSTLQLMLRARKLALLTQVGNELLTDAAGYGPQLESKMGGAIGWHLDTATLTGTGAGQPLGILNAPCLITISKESGQAASTIMYANLLKMFARLHPASMGNAVWVANPTTIPQLAQLSITIGTGGDHIPVMTNVAGQFIILTRPVLFTEKLPALGTLGDIVLCDFSQYVIGLRKEISIDRSQHVGFTRDTTYIRGLIRADGQPTWNAPMTPANGDTLSPFVALEAR